MEKINFVNGKAPALNATNLNKMQNNIEDAIYYKAGDKFSCSINHGYMCAGVISGSKKSLFFSMHTPKSLKNISSFTANKLVMSLRYDGNYVGGGNTFDYATDTTNYSIKLYKIDEHTILIMITSVPDLCSTNNISLTVDFNEFDIGLS